MSRIIKCFIIPICLGVISLAIPAKAASSSDPYYYYDKNPSYNYSTSSPYYYEDQYYGPPGSGAHYPPYSPSQGFGGINQPNVIPPGSETPTTPTTPTTPPTTTSPPVTPPTTTPPPITPPTTTPPTRPPITIEPGKPGHGVPRPTPGPTMPTMPTSPGHGKLGFPGV